MKNKNEKKNEENIDNPQAENDTEEMKSKKTENGSGKHDTSIEELMEIVVKKDEENEKLKKDYEDLKDMVQRKQADLENFKKRMLKQQDDFRKFALKDFALDVIMINDDLLRAIEASQNIPDSVSIEEAHDSFVEGVTMISKRIEDALAKYDVYEIEALNTAFDPNKHEAVEIEMDGNVDEDTVTKVHLKGFTIDEMVIRSSKVKVTKPGKKEDASGDGGAKDEEKETIQGSPAGQ